MLERTLHNKVARMVMQRNKRRRILLLLILATSAALWVSASLTSIQLQAGLLFPGGVGAQDHPDDLPDTYASDPAFRPASGSVLWVIPAFLLLLFLFLMFRQVETRRILYGIVVLSLFIGLIAALFGDSQTSGGLWLPPQEAPSDASRVGSLGTAPKVFIWVAIGGFGLLAVVFGVWLYRAMFQAISTKNLIKEEAKNALKEINDGGEWSNAIIRCYLQMVQGVQSERGIERGEAMTTQEFERVLVSHGFPENAVHRLTALFEKVRYGNKQADTHDEQTAVECLTVIIGSTGE